MIFLKKSGTKSSHLVSQNVLIDPKEGILNKKKEFHNKKRLKCLKNLLLQRKTFSPIIFMFAQIYG
jgi:hypothetical protein